MTQFPPDRSDRFKQVKCRAPVYDLLELRIIDERRKLILNFHAAFSDNQ